MEAARPFWRLLSVKARSSKASKEFHSVSIGLFSLLLLLNLLSVQSKPMKISAANKTNASSDGNKDITSQTQTEPLEEENTHNITLKRRRKADAEDKSKSSDLNLVSYYNLGEPIEDWDQKRKIWLQEHPHIEPYTKDGKQRLFILSGSQPTPCLNPLGDHLLLRSLKNKIDYSRLHDIGMLYNMVLMDPSMPTFWAKLPIVRSTMLSHPEVEWIWWVDADAIVTDMEFEIPLEKYTDVNFVVYGWRERIYEARSWVGLNAGSYLIRNCQWSMDFMERWVDMGPQAPLGEASAKILTDFLPDRPLNPTDDQAVLVYLLIKEKDKWGDKVMIETEYALSGYWLELVDGYETMEEKYKQMENEHPDLAKREKEREEKLVRKYGRIREQYFKNAGVNKRRAFITHFTGCQPCSGHHNKIYSKDKCVEGMIRALNYADDQVLGSYGYRHKTLDAGDVEAL